MMEELFQTFSPIKGPMMNLWKIWREKNFQVWLTFQIHEIHLSYEIVTFCRAYSSIFSCAALENITIR